MSNGLAQASSVTIETLGVNSLRIATHTPKSSLVQILRAALALMYLYRAHGSNQQSPDTHYERGNLGLGLYLNVS